MPIDNTTWEQANERESTATQITEFLRDNESEAYTTNELVAEIVPEETDDESVVAYYRAVLEALAHGGSVEKREIPAEVDGADLIPYYRTAEDEPEATRQSATTPAKREDSLDGPITVRLADERDTIPVRIEELPDEDDETSADVETPFFVRWYRWYRQQTRRR